LNAAEILPYRASALVRGASTADGLGFGAEPHHAGAQWWGELPENRPEASWALANAFGIPAREPKGRNLSVVRMPVHQQRFVVSFEYPVFFVRGVFEPENTVLVDAVRRREPERRHRVAFVVEERVAALWPELPGAIRVYADLHRASLELVGIQVVPGGEACKNDTARAEALIAQYDAWGLDRQAVVGVVGGGALQDMAGYAAAIAHRGLRVIRLPTTVLSQNDGGVGVKNGVNALGKKNLIGTFAPPFAVIDDFRFLATLEPRDKAAGMAEAVKVALLKDPLFFSWLVERADALARFEEGPLEELVHRCAVLHLRHIAEGGDPFELGSSRPLDFGHWAAHKLESLSGYRLRHGEAVAIGIALDSCYSAEVGLLERGIATEILDLLTQLGLPTWDETLEARDEAGARRVFEGLREFREHLGGDLTLTMLEAVGRGRDVHEIDLGILDDCMTRLGHARRPQVLPNRSFVSGGDEARAR
jgi:3-dehydroquinate synthase